jgi:hypothetical protein
MLNAHAAPVDSGVELLLCLIVKYERTS